ncbi:unnamed protein product [Spodoptera littoralis]|uniref:Uncharacterized protein n=1 Tax=Spodoptera littoralis TaxID=7109 RepID=A0A9P0ICQ6_SPOLI|nr:unnamed protein product [Spodoptera littoralis]CAH1643526.1 unnamed protein product [Spodoptera littoralis]
MKEQYVTKDSLDVVKSDLESLKRTSIVNNFGSTPRNINIKRGGFLLDSHDDYCSGPRGLAYVGAEHNNSYRESSEIRAESNYHNTQFLSESEGIRKNGREIYNNSYRESSEIRAESNYHNTQFLSESEGIRKNGREINNFSNESDCQDAALATGGTMTHTQSAAIEVPCEAGHTAVTNVSNTAQEKKKSMADIVRDGEWKTPKVDKEWNLVQNKRLRNRFAANRGRAILRPEASFKAADISIPI